jgi:carbon monoxide dehydrogenase subunit G
MDMNGERLIPAPKQIVWAALNDPETLRACIPGCESLEKTSDTEMTAAAAVKLGPVAAKFSGKLTLSDLDPPNGYTLSGEGRGGPAGFAKGSATVKLADAPDGTLLSYTVAAQVGGKIAQVGGRLIDATAKSMTDQFFKSFAAQIEAQIEAQVAAEQAEAAAPAPAPGLVARIAAFFCRLLRGGRKSATPKAGASEA